MSTISLPHEKQIRHFFVADTITDSASAAAFIDEAAIGEVGVFDQDGNPITFASGELVGKDLYILKKNNKGGVSRSDLITPKDVQYMRGVSPVAKVGATQVFSLSGVTVGEEYRLVGKVNYGNSEENFITFWAGTKAAAGDTATDVLTRLAKQMADNLAASVNTKSKESGTDTIIAGTTAKKNKYFTITVVGSDLTIAEKDWILEDFRVGLRTHDQLLWNFEIQGSEVVEGEVTKAETAPTFAKGQGYQMIELERYLVGHRAEFDLETTTLSFNRQYDVDVNADPGYYSLDLKYFDTSRDDEKHSDKMLTVVSTDPTVIDAIAFAIEAAAGYAEGTIWTELDPAGDGADNLP